MDLLDLKCNDILFLIHLGCVAQARHLARGLLKQDPGSVKRWVLHDIRLERRTCSAHHKTRSAFNEVNDVAAPGAVMRNNNLSCCGSFHLDFRPGIKMADQVANDEPVLGQGEITPLCHVGPKRHVCGLPRAVTVQ